MQEEPRTPGRGPAVAVAAAVVSTALVAAWGAHRLDPASGYDGAAFLRYAEVVKATGHLPSQAQTYEYASPPAYLWEAAQLSRIGLGWRGGQALSVLWAALLVLVAALLARELWPGRPWLWAGGAWLTAGVPIVIRLGTMFHPEMQFACLRRDRDAAGGARGPPRLAAGLDGAACGVVLGLAALTRQTAAA